MEINGKKLRLAIKSLDLTQEEAAKRLGIARQTLNTWFNLAALNNDIIQNVKTKLGIELGSHGNMLNEPETEYRTKEIKSVSVPIYNSDHAPGTIHNLINSDDNFFPVGYLSIPEVAGCDAIIRARGESMEPKINDGDWLGVKWLDNWRDWLPMNYIYAIDTDNLQLIRYLRKGINTDSFMISSLNKEYEDDEIPKKVIKGIWAVKAIIPISKMEILI